MPSCRLPESAIVVDGLSEASSRLEAVQISDTLPQLSVLYSHNQAMRREVGAHKDSGSLRTVKSQSVVCTVPARHLNDVGTRHILLDLRSRLMRRWRALEMVTADPGQRLHPVDSSWQPLA